MENIPQIFTEHHSRPSFSFHHASTPSLDEGDLFSFILGSNNMSGDGRLRSFQFINDNDCIFI